MHEAVISVAKLVEELAEANRKLEFANLAAEYAKRDAIEELRKSMEKALIESDIKREVAIARLDAYEKAGNKDDFNKEIREMLKLAISGLGARSGQQQKGQQQEKRD